MGSNPNQGEIMRTMFIIAALALTSVTSYAEENLKDLKNKENTRLSEKMSSLRSAQDCISGAKTLEAFKICKYDMHEKMKMQKMESCDHMKPKM